MTTETVDFFEDSLWNGIGRRMLRQTLAFQLNRVATVDRRLRARGLKLVDVTAAPAARNGSIALYPSVEFNRFYRIKDHRVMVGCSLKFTGLDEEGEIVRRERSLDSLYQKVYKLSPDGNWGTLERVLRQVLPLQLQLGEQRITFSKLGFPFTGVTT